MSINHKACLVLNSDYTPIAIIDWKKAMVWSYRSYHDSTCVPMDIVEYYNQDYIQTIGTQLLLPAVIKLVKFAAKLVVFAKPTVATNSGKIILPS